MNGWAEAVAAVEEVARNTAEGSDEAASFPTEVMSLMRETRLLGVSTPETYGGAGAGISDIVAITERLGRVDMSTAMIFTMHCQQVAALASHGSARLCEEVLPRVAVGELYLGSVTTERTTGGRLTSSDSEVSADEQGLHLDRDAPVVTGGEYADAFLITTRAPNAEAQSTVDLVYATASEVDLSVMGGWDPMGMRGTRSVAMRLTGVVPEWRVIGGHGAFRRIATNTFGPWAHLGWSAAWLGAASGALSRFLRHMRSSSGRAQIDPTSDLVRLRLASVRERLEVTNALLRHCLIRFEQVEDPSAVPLQTLLNTLKVRSSVETFHAVHELMDLAGMRHGYMRKSPIALERVFRDLRSASLNFSNDRLHLATGALTPLDADVLLG